jgi:hypothetical protein
MSPAGTPGPRGEARGLASWAPSCLLSLALDSLQSPLPPAHGHPALSLICPSRPGGQRHMGGPALGAPQSLRVHGGRRPGPAGPCTSVCLELQGGAGAGPRVLAGPQEADRLALVTGRCRSASRVGGGRTVGQKVTLGDWLESVCVQGMLGSECTVIAHNYGSSHVTSGPRGVSSHARSRSRRPLPSRSRGPSGGARGCLWLCPGPEPPLGPLPLPGTRALRWH